MENELQLLYSPSFYACGCPSEYFDSKDLCSSCNIKDKFNLDKSPEEVENEYVEKAKEKIKTTGMKFIQSKWEYKVAKHRHYTVVEIIVSANVHDEIYYKLAGNIGEQINDEKENVKPFSMNNPYVKVCYFMGAKTKEERKALEEQVRINLDLKRKEEWKKEYNRILNIPILDYKPKPETKTFMQSLKRFWYWIIAFFMLFCLGCSPDVTIIDSKENIQEAIFVDFTAYELCPNEQIEYTCQQCNILYPEANGVCGHTFENGDVCIAGYLHYEDFITCTKRETDVTKCTLCK